MSHPIPGRSQSTGVEGRPRGSRLRRGAGATAAAVVLAAGLAAPSVVAVVNVNPIAYLDVISGDEDTVLTGNVLTNDVDPDGGTLSVYSFTPPTYGTMTLSAGGDLSFTPPPNWSGSQTTTYNLSDGQGGFALGYIQLNVAGVNDAPVANGDTAGTDEDVAVEIPAATLLANDTDADADRLAVTGVSGAVGGTATFAAGTASYTPTADWCGAGSFDYAIEDGHGGTDSATVAVTVACVNDAPVAVDDEAMVAQNGPATTINVTANDEDVDGDTLTVTAASVAPAAGTVTIASASSVRFTPADLFEGDASIGYTISDGHGGTASATLVVAVVADDVVPVAVAPATTLGTGRVNERAPLAVTWSGSDVGVGVGSYEVEASVNGGAWAPVYAGAGTSLAKLYPFGTRVAFRVRAIDRVGNQSAWAAGPVRTIAAFQAPGSTAVGYAGTWTTVMSTAASGVGYRYTTARAGSATLTFTGREVLYVAPRSPLSGTVRVYVDGVFVRRVDLRAASFLPGQIVLRRTWATSGVHTIRVVNDTPGRRASLDAFIVLR